MSDKRHPPVDDGRGGWMPCPCEWCQMVAENATLRELVERAQEALVWCSGSADFGEGGQAREGWNRLCATLLTDAAAALGKEE